MRGVLGALVLVSVVDVVGSYRVIGLSLGVLVGHCVSLGSICGVTDSSLGGTGMSLGAPGKCQGLLVGL